MEVRQATCPKCNKVFNFDQNVVPKVQSGSPGSGEMVQLKCPQCGLSFTFDMGED